MLKDEAPTFMTREEAEAFVRKVKRQPAFWWNYILVWCLSKGLITLKTADKLKWVIKIKSAKNE